MSESLPHKHMARNNENSRRYPQTHMLSLPTISRWGLRLGSQIEQISDLVSVRPVERAKGNDIIKSDVKTRMNTEIKIIFKEHNNSYHSQFQSTIYLIMYRILNAMLSCR